MEQEDFTDKEKELIYAIRNYRRAFPNGNKALEAYAESIFYELMDNE